MMSCKGTRFQEGKATKRSDEQIKKIEMLREPWDNALKKGKIQKTTVRE
jgi:hypothetical protein